MVEAVKRGFPQREIADAAFRYQQEVERGERVVVGVNAFEQEDDGGLELLRIDPALEGKQVARLQSHRARRDSAAVESALGALRETAAQEDANLMPGLLDCARAGASEGEIVESLQTVFGTYAESPVF
jgi:methylmalonyl-CoA mutase N-terminal domain/subunit